MKRSIHKISQLIKRANKKPFSIFLLEDNKLYLRGISSQLRSNFGSHIRLNSFSRSGNFLNSLRKKPEIAVVDYHLDENSEIEGLNLIKELKKTSPSTRIIVLTGEKTIDTAIKCLNIGATDYIIKEGNALDKVANDINIAMQKTLIKIEKEAYNNTINGIIALVVTVALTIMVMKQWSPEILD